jgi:hypothetical protein
MMMLPPMLKDLLLAPGRRAAVIDDCLQLVDDQVARKSGLSGLAIKGAYGIVKTVKPGFVREAVDNLLDEFVERLEPLYSAATGAGTEVSAYFAAHASDVAEGLLGVTDARAQHAANATVKKAYEKLRPTAKKHVEAAVPGVGLVVARHAGAAAA